MEIMSAREAADKWGISQRRVAVLCSENRIANAEMIGNMWVMPSNARKPIDARSTRNVPMGAYKNPLICDEINLRTVSDKLQRVIIVCGDYRKSAEFIDKNTFVYFDPPYRPITDTASFTAYTENLFNDEEQVELAHFVDDMHRKGAKIVISNSDPKNSNTEDDFFDNIYSTHKIKRVEATRMINCNSEARGKIKELLISNF